MAQDNPLPKLRGLADFGVISDLDPVDLPPNAFSFAQNVRFRNGRVSAAPVFKTVFSPLGTVSPRYLAAANPNFSTNWVFIGYENGAVSLFSNGSETAYSPSVTFSATIASTVMTVSGSPSGQISPGMSVTGAGVTSGTTISSFGSGSGGAGTYNLSTASTVGSSESMTAAYVPNTEEATWSSCFLEGVFYINRSDRVPWSVIPANSNFQFLANMDNQWTAQLLRTCGGTLVALNVIENGTDIPVKVKTAEFPTYGAVPVSWNDALASTDATENELASMQGPITDACNLGLDLVIYGQYEAWRMTLSGDIEVFDYFKLPFSKGSINANCSLEINSQNYVFGVDDIWMHDGVTEKSICDQRTRDFIFGNIDMSQTQLCFVAHNRALHEIHFNFASGDGFTKFPSAGFSGCNRCATYDYMNDRWVYDDRPGVYGAALANVDLTLTYATATQTYATITGSYQNEDDTAKRVLCYVSDDNTTTVKSLYAYDPVQSSLPGMPASVVNFPIDEAATGFPYLLRTDMDLDSLPNVDLQGYKVLSYIIPIGRIDPASSQMIQFNVGVSDYINQSINYAGYQGFDGMSNYKLDYNAAGRYLSYEVTFQDYTQFSWSGFDFDIIVTAER